MSVTLVIACMLLAFLAEYVVALYAHAVFVNTDELRELFPGLRTATFERIAAVVTEPRTLLQTLAVFRSIVLILNTALTMLMLTHMVETTVPVWLAVLALLGVWLLHMVFVEFLPRQTSRQAVRQTMGRHVWLLLGIHLLCSPLIKLYRLALGRSSSLHQVTEEEKEEIVERAIETLADQAGFGETIIEAEEKEMIGGIFQLDQTVAREIMVPRIDIAALDEHASPDQIRSLIATTGHSRFPVFSGTIDSIIGILYVKDLYSHAKSAELPALHQIVRRAYFVPENKIIGELLREFRQQKVHIAIVIDDYGGVSGLVTLEDVLEEIVGEIQDEHDTEEPDFHQLADGRYSVSAGMLVDDFQRQIETDHNQGDYDTVGGLIYHLVGQVPQQGTMVRWYDLEFEVARIDERRIKRLIVHRTADRTDRSSSQE